MPRSKGHGRAKKAGRHANKKASVPKDSSTNLSRPPKNTATVETAKDRPIHTSIQREESSSINLNAALDDDVLDESPPNELKNTTIDQTKILLLLWLIQKE